MLLKNKFTIPFVKKNIYNLNDISDKELKCNWKWICEQNLSIDFVKKNKKNILWCYLTKYKELNLYLIDQIINDLADISLKI